MIGRAIGFYTKRYSEIFLYLCLLVLLSLHKFFGFANLSLLVLLLPLLFVDIKLLDRWAFLWLFYPLLFLLGFGLDEMLNLALYAFAEEVFFRAYLMRRYSNLLVSLMFALPHFILYQNLQSLLTFFPSLLFGYAYSKTGSVNLATSLHLWANVIARIFY